MQKQVDQSRGSRLTRMILLACLLGAACGLFFGPACAWLQPIGNAFVGLLQMAVLPYVTCSLVANIGRFSLRSSGRVLLYGVQVLLLLWGIGLITVVAMSWAFPQWKTGSFFSVSLVDTPEPLDWQELFIPSNPFWSLAGNFVPAVVVFSIGLGIAITGVPNKERLLDQLDVLVQGMTRLNKMVVQLSPLGLFAVVAHAVGTLTLDQFALCQGYLLTYAGASLLLTFGLLPAIVSSCTPFGYREVIGATRNALIAAFVIGNTFVVLPLIVDALDELMKKHPVTENPEQSNPGFMVPLAYPFPDIGRIVGLLFVPFAAWFYGQTIDPTRILPLLGVGTIAAFAKPVVTVPLLLEIAEVPGDIFNLFLSIGFVASRFGDLMKCMHLIAFASIVSCRVAGIARINWPRLCFRVSVVAGVTALFVASLHSYLIGVFEGTYSRSNLVVARPLLLDPVPATILDRAEPNPAPRLPGESRMERIVRRGVIRVGYLPDQMPFSYFNLDGELVGLDVEMAHQLAEDLAVTIEFVPIETDLRTALVGDQFDIAMAGLEGTVKRAAELPHPPPYLELTDGLVVPDYRRKDFRTLEQIRNQQNLRLAVRTDSLASETIAGEFPQVDLVQIESEREFFESNIADALATSLEVGSAWTIKHPGYTVVLPEGVNVKVPLYYYTSPENNELEEFLEAWVALKQRDSTLERLYDYWILGKEPVTRQRRWSIMRDVLNW